jgi:hypothetical protein
MRWEWLASQNRKTRRIYRATDYFPIIKPKLKRPIFRIHIGANKMRAMTSSEVSDVAGGLKAETLAVGGAELWVGIVAGVALSMTGVGAIAGGAILLGLGGGMLVGDALL